MNHQPEGTRVGRRSAELLILLAFAALAYGFHIGSWSLDDAEAYSALAASQTSLAAVVENGERRPR